MSTIIQKSKENEFKELSPKIKLDYEHNSKVVKNLLSKEELTKRYKIFCRAFDLNVGDIIYIYGWNFYYIGEDCFYLYDSCSGKQSNCKYPPYEHIINRGFFKTKIIN